MLNVTVATWIGNAAAVVSGTWGAVTRRAQQSGYSRTTVYAHGQRVVQAVASAQAGGISYDALWHENERLKAENEALWQAWAEAEDLREAKQRALASSGCAMGLSLSQIITLLAIILPPSAVPSRAMVGRWVQEAAARAGRLLVVLDLACQARVRVLSLDEIFLHRVPVVDGDRAQQHGLDGGPTGSGSYRGELARGDHSLALSGARHRRWGPGA